MNLTFKLETSFFVREKILLSQYLFLLNNSQILTMHDKVIGRTPTGYTEAYASSLSADCDPDL